MVDPRSIVRRALLCAVLSGTPATVALADGVGVPPATTVDLSTGGQNGYT